ncbi:von Willebrand factor A-like protein [Gracilaria domingensis]|nr:von Willebrand factor A-like protein [Gracilaria domingensis]
MHRPISLLIASVLIALTFAVGSAVGVRDRISSIDSPLTEGRANQAQIQAAIAIVQATECNPNVCFAVDGSASMNDMEFQLEKDFVKLVAAIVALDPGSRFAGVQYGLRPAYISTLTNNADQFLLDVHTTVSLEAGVTFIAPGLGGCMRQLKNLAGQPKKIILLGDGGSNFDAEDPPLDPESIAQQFLENPNNLISAVGVGNFQDPDMLEDIAGSPDRVFTVDEWEDVIDVLAALVLQVCGDVEF